ncbi:MAG: response regulator [Phycisphaerales bacterium]
MTSRARSSSRTADRPARSNTIGASERDLAHLIRAFERGDGPKDAAVKRVHARWPFAQTSVAARLIHPGGTEIRLSFACRNLSRTGIGLLHNTYVHAGSRIEIELPRSNGVTDTVSGEVARCSHRQGVIHEIGVRFDKEIPLPEYVRPDIFEGWLSFESVKPEDIEGSVVHADPSKIDRKIVSHYLRDTGVSLRQVESGADALKSIGSGCDLIVAEADLGDMSGAELVRKIRDSGSGTPVLVVGPELDAQTRSQMTASGVNGYLLKPFECDQFLRGIAEFLVAETTDSAGRATEPGHPGRLHQLAEHLDRFIAEGASVEAYVVCQQISGIAPRMGFDAIAKRAAWVADKLAEGHATSALAGPAGELAHACRDLRPAA